MSACCHNATAREVDMAVRNDTRKGWIIDFVYQHADGTTERVRKTSPVQTKRGAEEHERHLRQEMLAAPSRKEITKVRLNDFTRDFLDTHVATKKHSTRITYESTIRVHLTPAFGNRWLEEIDAKSIERLRTKMITAGSSEKTAKNTIGVLSKMLHVAKKWGHLAELPEIEFGHVPQPGFRFLTDDEARALLAEAGPYWYGPIFTALQAGLRQGELWALTREQVDLQRGALRIDRAVWRSVVSQPKHDKIRTVDIPPSLAAFLRDHLRVVPLSTRLVFPKEEGGMRLERKADQGLRRAFKRAGIVPCGWHVLRHTYASRLVMAGTPLVAVKELLGHSDIRTTMRYAHVGKDFKAEAVKVLDSLVTEGSDGTLMAQGSDGLAK